MIWGKDLGRSSPEVQGKIPKKLGQKFFKVFEKPVFGICTCNLLLSVYIYIYIYIRLLIYRSCLGNAYRMFRYGLDMF